MFAFAVVENLTNANNKSLWTLISFANFDFRGYRMNVLFILLLCCHERINLFFPLIEALPVLNQALNVNRSKTPVKYWSHSGNYYDSWSWPSYRSEHILRRAVSSHSSALIYKINGTTRSFSKILIVKLRKKSRK